MKRCIILLSCAFIMMTLGCASYYKVTDPASGNVYYTDDVNRKGTTIIFQDVQTKSTVTLQNSEVLEISKEEFQAVAPEE